MITKFQDLRELSLDYYNYIGDINRWIQDGNFNYSYQGHFNAPLPIGLNNFIDVIIVKIDNHVRYIESFEGDGTDPYSVTLTEIVPMGRVHEIYPIIMEENGVKFTITDINTYIISNTYDLTDIRNIASIEFNPIVEDNPVRVAFSFDNRNTWAYHDSTSFIWENCEFNEILNYGMSISHIHELTSDDYFHPLAFNKNTNSLDIALFSIADDSYVLKTILLSGIKIIDFFGKTRYRSIGLNNKQIKSSKIEEFY